MESDFDIVLKEYRSDPSNIVDSTADYYQALVRDIPEYISELVGYSYIVKGSCGQGNKAQNPWVCIFDEKITDSATHGLYVCYLFRSDMTGFYLALSQGITIFSERFGGNKYNAARKVALYFQRQITDDYFSREQIDLRSPKGSLGYGYKMTTILSKFYAVDSFNSETLRLDLDKMMAIYRQLARSMNGVSYDTTINTVYSNQEDELQSVEDAIRSISSVIGTEEEGAAEEKKLVRVSTIEPKAKTYKGIASRAPRKIDYLKKAESDGKVGLKGEKLVLDYEREKVRAAGRDDLINEIIWVAEDDDSLGYDISSFEFDDNGNAKKIRIEVKTTKSELNNPFFITDNELKAIHSNPDDYRIYRVSVKKGEPTLHIIKGADFEGRYSLTPQSYLATLEN